MVAPGAFLCYAREDDADEGGKISWFCTELQKRVRFQGVTSFEIFQDRASIEYSTRWKRMIDSALDTTSLLIPILTPRWFGRDECRREFERFLERERQLGRDDLVLGIYWFRTDQLDDPTVRDTDPLAIDLSSRQLVAWHELRYEPDTAPTVRRRFDEIASRINGLVRADSVPVADGSPPQSNPAVSTASHAPAEVATPVSPSVPEPPVRVVDPFPGRGQYLTIKDAIEAAEPGDRVVLRPGVYEEGIRLDKPVEIIGDGRAEDIVVSARGCDAVVMATTIARIANVSLIQVGDGAWSGVDAQVGRLTIEDCIITSQSLACVAIHNGAAPVIRHNRIIGGRQAGVYVSENGLGTIEDNDISDNAFAGVEIMTGGNPTVRHNRITAGRAGGVYVWENGLGTIEDNDISDNALSGIEIRAGGNPTVRRNRITAGRAGGVFVFENGLGTIEDNDISDNALAGIEIKAGGNPTVRRNRITAGQQDGIFVFENGLGTIEDNDISDNALSGIEIKAGGNPTVRGNRITAGRAGGVFVWENGLGTIEDNHISDNTLAGIEIRTGGNPTVRHNRITAGRAGGVFVWENGLGTIEDNHISDNTLAGIEIRTGGNPTIRGNRIRRNRGGGVQVQSRGQGTLEGNEVVDNQPHDVEIADDAGEVIRD